MYFPDFSTHPPKSDLVATRPNINARCRRKGADGSPFFSDMDSVGEFGEFFFSIWIRSVKSGKGRDS